MRAVFSFKNIDSTSDMNARFDKLFIKGFFDGGDVSPIAGELKVSISAFRAISADGMVILEESATQLTVVAGVDNHICLYAKYSSTAAPTLEWLVLTPSAYAGHANKDYLILRAKVNVTAGATAVTAAMIATSSADEVDKQGRNSIRGLIPNISGLPSSHNRTGDSYIVTDGSGDTPNLYVYNGQTFLNITQSGSVSASLTLHRQNLYTNEIHATSEQAAALAGTSGAAPNATNRYVDSSDARVPTQNENNAMVGVKNTSLDEAIVAPSDVNRFITESRQFAAPEEWVVATPPNDIKLEFPISQGPTYVGIVAGMNSAFKYFKVYHSDDSQSLEYVNSTGDVPKIIGIYTDASFATALDPVTHTKPPSQATPTGFYSGGSLWIVFDKKLDSAFRLGYFKQKTLKNLSPEELSVRSPFSFQTPGSMMFDPIESFPITSATSLITLTKFTMNPNPVNDVVVRENGVFLEPDDNETFTPIVIQTGVSDKIDFIDSTATTKQAVLSPATYSTKASLAVLASDIAAKMSLVTSDTIQCSFSTSTWKFTWLNTTGNFSILWSSGAAAIYAPWKKLGVSPKADWTGAATYSSNEPINRGHIQWMKNSSTVIQLINSAQPNGLITVTKKNA